MNILIFDHKNQLHQFDTYKQWAKSFLHDYKFLSAGPQERQTIIENISEEVFEAGRQTIDISNQEAIAKLSPDSLCVSHDYGITIIDCPRKSVVSLNEYTHLGIQSFTEISNLLSPNYTVSNKIEQLKNYQLLIENGYLHFSTPNTNEKLLSKIKAYLSSPSLSSSPKHSKGQYGDFMLHHEDSALSKDKTGWNFKTTGDYYSLEVYKTLYTMLEKNKIHLTQEQKNAWNDFVNQQMSYAEEPEEDAFNHMLEKMQIQREKRKITKQLSLAAPKENDTQLLGKSILKI